MPTEAVLTKGVPTLAEWLGDGRAEGFERWAALSLMWDAPPDEATFLRIAQTFSVACVEQMRREAERDPSPEAIGAALGMWARAAGYVTIAAAASVLRDDAPYRRLARIWAEEFRVGGKLAADALARQHEEGSHAD